MQNSTRSRCLQCYTYQLLIVSHNNIDLFTNVFTSQTGLHKTVQSQIVWGLLKTVGDCRQLNSHHRRWQDSLCHAVVGGVNWALQRFGRMQITAMLFVTHVNGQQICWHFFCYPNNILIIRHCSKLHHIMFWSKTNFAQCESEHIPHYITTQQQNQQITSADTGTQKEIVLPTCFKT